MRRAFWALVAQGKARAVRVGARVAYEATA